MSSSRVRSRQKAEIENIKSLCISTLYSYPPTRFHKVANSTKQCTAAEEAGHAVTSRQKSRVKLAFPEFHACEWLRLGLSCSSGRLLSRCPGVIPVGEPLGRFCVSILSAHVQKSHPFVGVASRAGITGWLSDLQHRRHSGEPSGVLQL